MKNPFKNLFKKSEPKPILQSVNEITTGEKPKHKQDIIVDADVAFREPPSKKIAEIRALFEPVKFDELEFEEEIGDFALDLISKESKRKIIEIIKEDIKTRASKREPTFIVPTFENGMTREQTSFVINKDAESRLYRKKIEEELKGKSPLEQIQYFENALNEMGNFERPSAEDVIAFKEKFKEHEEQQAKEHEKNRYQLLYQTTATNYPDFSHEEIIEFIKEHFTHE